MNTVTSVHIGDMWQSRALEKGKEKQGKGESRGDHKGKGNGKTGKCWWREPERKGKRANGTRLTSTTVCQSAES